MSKYSSSAHRPPRPPRDRIHPGVRIIGCLSMIVLPVFSWTAASLLIDGPARGWGLPSAWLERPSIHPLLLSLSGLDPVWRFLQGQAALTGKLVFAVVIMVVLGGVTSIVYGYIFSMLGPSKYGPQDVPPPRIQTKKYKR